MLSKIIFGKFDFRGFIDFICYLGDQYGMNQIIFNPDNRQLFTDFQLKHIAPCHDINNQEGFVWAWIQMQNKVRNVDFNLFTKDNTKRMRMSIKLDDKVISLDKVMGISPAQIEKALKDNMESLEGINSQTSKKVAILNRGKNNFFFKNIFKGDWDVGIQDEGEDTVAVKNKFDSPLSELSVKWHETWWGKIIIGVVVVLLGSIILYFII